MLSAKARAFSIDSLLAVGPGVTKESHADFRRQDLGVCHREHPTKKHSIRKCFHPALHTIAGIFRNIILFLTLQLHVLISYMYFYFTFGGIYKFCFFSRMKLWFLFKLKDELIFRLRSLRLMHRNNFLFT